MKPIIFLSLFAVLVTSVALPESEAGAEAIAQAMAEAGAAAGAEAGSLETRAIGSSCRLPSGLSGTCQTTSYCASGASYPGYCPGTPSNVQCCVYTACYPPGASGLCRNTYKACSGVYRAGYCPGNTGIQCCS